MMYVQEMAMGLIRFRRTLAAALLLAASLLGGCDDNVEITGIGVSTGLPSAYMSGSDEVGVGNVHWVGNPRW